MYVVKSPTDVKLRKDLGSSKTVKNSFDSGERIFVSDGPRVDPSIILCGSFFSILFGDEEEGGCIWRLGGTNSACTEVLVNKFLN